MDRRVQLRSEWLIPSNMVYGHWPMPSVMVFGLKLMVHVCGPHLHMVYQQGFQRALQVPHTVGLDKLGHSAPHKCIVELRVRACACVCEYVCVLAV